MFDEKLLQILVGVINAKLFETVKGGKWCGMKIDDNTIFRKLKLKPFEPVDIEILEPKNIQYADRASWRTFGLVYGIIYFTDYVYK